MVHQVAEKVSALYDDLKVEVESLLAKKEALQEDLAGKQKDLLELQASVDAVNSTFERQRSELSGDRQEFEEFKAEALQQLETWRDKLEAERRDEEARAEARATIEAEKADLSDKLEAYDQERRTKEAELTQIAADLDREKTEFEGYRSTTQAELERQLESSDAERQRHEEETRAFEQFREETAESTRKQHEELEAQQQEFERMRGAVQAELGSDRDELARALLDFERTRDEERAALAAEKGRQDAKQQDLEKLHEELVNLRRKLARDRRHYDDERKHLAKMLLGMGEKISTETIGAHSGGEEFEAQKEVPVYGGELGEGNLLGSVPVYSSSTVGDVKAFISERFTLTPGANLRKRDAPISNGQDREEALNFFKAGDYIVAADR